jgi:uncharacterized membrane protein (TIGR02234 family)
MADRPRDRTFAPAVVGGLAAAALTAVGCGQDWAVATSEAAGVGVRSAAKGSSSAPLGIALALVALAAWGVLLVTRGRVRRVVAVLGAAAALGVVLTVALATGTLHDDATAAAVARGATTATHTSLTGWYVVTLVAAALTTVAFAVAVVRSPRWPAMGSRYDAPGARTGPVADHDLWRAIDEGRDPTA